MELILSALITLLPAGAEEPKKMIIVGDSLTEGYGVAQSEAYPARLEALIQAHGKAWHVVNSGISGSTSASAPQRVTWALKQKPQLVVLALGANDGLRGLSVKDLETNLGKALKACQNAAVKVILVGMKVPPNFGAKYGREFEAVYPHLAQTHHVPLIPFLLADVAGKPALNQSDGIHPTAAGHKILAETMYRGLESAL